MWNTSSAPIPWWWASNSPADLRRGLLETVRGRGGAVTESVADALLTVPRHVFVLEVDLDRAYSDEAIVTKRDADGVPISSSSQPTIMAIMLDQLGLAPGHRMLEIGAGTGFNAALMAHLVGRPDSS
jgi:protein-L-isoaspartate(D-aspartate) O-methyltransferase